jgi:integrase
MHMKLKHVKHYTDFRGRPRTYFRKKGCKLVPLPNPSQPEFHAAYAAALAESVSVMPGQNRGALGTVGRVIGDWLASPDFTTRPESIRKKHRPHAEAFAAKYGVRRFTALDADPLERIYATMADTPAKANDWRMCMKDLYRFAIRRKLVAYNWAADLKKMRSKNPDGHHTWEPSEVEQFRKRHPIGTKARLAMELHWWLALRRSDAIRLGPGHVQDGKLRYTQHKMRARNPSHVAVDMPAELMRIIASTPGTGLKTWLVDGTGKPFTEDAYSHFFADMIKAAGLPDRCTPHGLRKRALTDVANAGGTGKEIGALGGQRALGTVERYIRKAENERLAGQAMAKRRRANIA